MVFRLTFRTHDAAEPDLRALLPGGSLLPVKGCPHPKQYCQSITKNGSALLYGDPSPQSLDPNILIAINFYSHFKNMVKENTVTLTSEFEIIDKYSGYLTLFSLYNFTTIFQNTILWNITPHRT
jgi:hypothetical protein